MNELFKNKLLTLINKRTRVTSIYISAMDHMKTNFLLNSISGIIKADLSDYFAIL